MELFVSNDQAPLVSKALTLATSEPASASEVFGLAVKTGFETTLEHVGLVLDQLVLFGFMITISDGRYFSTEKGDNLLAMIKKHAHCWSYENHKKW